MIRRVRTKCAAKGCGWTVLCSLHGNDKSWRIKTLNGPHNCLPAAKNKRVSAKTIAAKFKDDILRMPNMRARNIRALVKKRYGINIDVKQEEQNYKS